MHDPLTIKINFRGGIISPGDLYNILVATGNLGIQQVRFGLRQQLFIEGYRDTLEKLAMELMRLDIPFESGNDHYPNIVSSYPAEEVFITNTWLSEGVYKDIFDAFDYQPVLKINISDSNQSFTPSLTGNINWVASSSSLHFWHLFIRFPRTNIVFEWEHMVYTNDIPRLSREIEKVILAYSSLFCDNQSANGKLLFEKINTKDLNIRPAGQAAALPPFNLPYYEGLNPYNENKFWLGIYMRDEQFSVAFLKELCLLCLETRVGQLCSTPWKTIIIKGIEEADKSRWSRLLEKYEVNMRHAANELNFQVEDNCYEGLTIKKYLVKRLNKADMRSFGICFGIKTRKKSEVFSSILIKRKSLISFWGIHLFNVYDILCARDFNPNERTGFVFSKNNPRFWLGDELRRTIRAFYKFQADKHLPSRQKTIPVKEPDKNITIEYVYQCCNCYTVFDPVVGDAQQEVEAGTGIDALPPGYTCSVCDSPAEDFNKIEKSKLGLQAV